VTSSITPGEEWTTIDDPVPTPPPTEVKDIVTPWVYVPPGLFSSSYYRRFVGVQTSTYEVLQLENDWKPSALGTSVGGSASIEHSDEVKWGIGGDWSVSVDLVVFSVDVPVAGLAVAHADTVTLNYTLGPVPHMRFRAHAIIPKVSTSTTGHGETSINGSPTGGVIRGPNTTQNNGSAFIAGSAWHKQAACDGHQ
jgi:hypothetical protein